MFVSRKDGLVTSLLTRTFRVSNWFPAGAWASPRHFSEGLHPQFVIRNAIASSHTHSLRKARVIAEEQNPFLIKEEIKMAINVTNLNNMDLRPNYNFYPSERAEWSASEWANIIKQEEFAEAYEAGEENSKLLEALEDEFPEIFNMQDCPF
ncbi:MAG: hypothetical protein COA43_00485 [Robiginitomaculum sp.]|nr:MAG: hypothetical protein COA43_00485 [Robiginitomaculum sp.]